MGVEDIAAEPPVRALAGLAVAAPKGRPLAGVAVPHGGHLCLVTTLAELDSLGEAWQALEERAALPINVFQTHAWCSAWARYYAGPGSPNELCILTGYRDGALAFVWPLMKARTGPLTVLRWLSEPFAQYGDVLVASDSDAGAWFGSSLDLIRRLKAVHSVRLRHVRTDANIYPFLRDAFRPAGEPDAAPFLDLGVFANEQAYEQRYCKEQRRRRKRIRKELEKLGPVRLERIEAGSLMDRAIEQALGHKRRWLEKRGLYSQPVSCALIGRFLSELSRRGVKTPLVTMSCLTAGHRPVSWEIGLRFGTTHFGFITAHDTALTDASPARLHMDLSQRQAIADGMRVFDLMVPADAHKVSWSSAQVAVHDFHVPLSRAGRLYGRLYLEWARPLLRRVYYSAPPALRALLTHCALLTL